jgi:hypothetical protein
MSEAKALNKKGFWREHSAAWKLSGLTQAAYCEQKGINYQSFVYQHNRLAGTSKKPSLNFIKTKPELTKTSGPGGGLFLVLPNGIRLGIGDEVKAALLQTVLSVACGITC